MSSYSVIEAGYYVHEINNIGGIVKTYEPGSPEYIKGLDVLVESFNEAKLEQYLDDEDALRFLGYKIKDKIQSIRMKRLSKTDDHNYPYIRITVTAIPGMLKLTSKVKDFLDDYISAQFSDGWGEAAFYPYNTFEVDGREVGVE